MHNYLHNLGITYGDVVKVLTYHAPFGIIISDIDGRILKVNTPFVSLVGYTEIELIQLSIFDITNPEDSRNERLIYRELMSENSDHYSITKRLLTKQESMIWVRCKTVIMKGNSVTYGVTFCVPAIQFVTNNAITPQNKVSIDIPNFIRSHLYAIVSVIGMITVGIISIIVSIISANNKIDEMKLELKKSEFIIERIDNKIKR